MFKDSDRGWGFFNLKGTTVYIVGKNAEWYFDLSSGSISIRQNPVRSNLEFACKTFCRETILFKNETLSSAKINQKNLSSNLLWSFTNSKGLPWP